MTNPRVTPDPQAAEVGVLVPRMMRTGAFTSAHPPWEEEVVADRRDVDDFKEASHTIGRVLSMRIPVLEF
jgi:hypothetical protein